jgi:bifunctional DNA-binding transcriptional regulator/antitoxin component of YhaV-PrlF toxin-antitoxin module
MESELKMARKALAAMKANEDQAMILAEVDQLKAQKQQMQTELAEIKRMNEQHASRNAELVRDVSDLRARTLDFEKPFLRIGKEQYSLAAIINEGRTARNVTEKIQVKNVPWRIGNIIDVFIAEQILAHQAQEEMLAVDKAVKEALVKQYVLSAEEGAYLEKYLTIDSLVKKRFASPVIAEKEAREYYEKHKDQYTHGREKRIRVLSVKYGKTDELEKSLLAVEMQQEAQEGRPFDAIANKRSTATMKEMSLSRLPDWARAKLAGLKEGEISNIISADNEYMIIQPIPSKPTFRSFEEVRKEIEKKLSAEQSGKKESFAKWFESLKKDAEFLLY